MGVVVDFGVFGFPPVHNWKYNKFNSTEDMINDMKVYVRNVCYVLKDDGMWILKLDPGWWIPDEVEKEKNDDIDENKIFDDVILSFFEKGSFSRYKSGKRVKSYRFIFLKKKKNIP